MLNRKTLFKTTPSSICTILLSAVVLFSSLQAYAGAAVQITPDVAAKVKALRLANTITGGYMPISDPVFAQMVSKIQGGDVIGAANLASHTNYFASYLARRLAFQMQNPAFDPSIVKDNDATAFIISHFIGGGGQTPSISSLWSENATYLVKVGANAPVHVGDLSADQINSLDWASALVPVSGQNARMITDLSNNTLAPIAIPFKHVGGYITLSDRVDDGSFAMYGATAGTNLRMIEGLWEVSTGVTLVDMESDSGQAGDAPRFVPENNPNFFHGQGQTACIACHGGGASSLTHGYSTVADLFDYDANLGFLYQPNPATVQRKSLGSDRRQRATNLACDLVKNPTAVCNPDSAGADASQAWNLASWAQTGLLNTMGWTAPITGQGLNELGVAIGQARIVYEFMTKRVINEICPMGMFTAQDLSSIVKAVNPYAVPAGTDDIRTIVALVASHASCQ